MTDDELNAAVATKRQWFGPKPQMVFDSPWTFQYEPPLSECGTFWQWYYSKRMRRRKLVLMAIVFVLPFWALMMAVLANIVIQAHK